MIGSSEVIEGLCGGVEPTPPEYAAISLAVDAAPRSNGTKIVRFANIPVAGGPKVWSSIMSLVIGTDPPCD